MGRIDARCSQNYAALARSLSCNTPCCGRWLLSAAVCAGTFYSPGLADAVELRDPLLGGALLGLALLAGLGVPAVLAEARRVCRCAGVLLALLFALGVAPAIAPPLLDAVVPLRVRHCPALSRRLVRGAAGARAGRDTTIAGRGAPARVARGAGGRDRARRAASSAEADENPIPTSSLWDSLCCPAPPKMPSRTASCGGAAAT